MPLALVSVSDKRGIDDFCSGLVSAGWKIVSTGGTAAALRDAGVEVTDVSSLTGFPEMLGGRVKTLHPAVHGGILARRQVPGDMARLKELEIAAIDLVAVNLYPFREAAADKSLAPREVVERIDIGGPALLRAAAKNSDSVWVLCDPDDYPRALGALERRAAPAKELRGELAAKAFAHTSSYDAAIAAYVTSREVTAGLHGQSPLTPDGSWAAGTSIHLRAEQTLRYGENPGQRAAFYRGLPGGAEGSAARGAGGIPGMDQLNGKELSYNNILDLDGALGALRGFAGPGGEPRGPPVCVIVKHTTPCGFATGETARRAFEKARATDPLSAFGSVVAFSRGVDSDTAAAMGDLFVECVTAPAFSEAALEILCKKKNLRILAPAPGGSEKPGRAGHVWAGLDLRGVLGGVLVQESAPVPAPLDLANTVTKRRPAEAELHDLDFAWRAVQSVKSNAILLASGGAAIGIGAGQMSRVDSVHIAVNKTNENGVSTTGAALASDAFFPFRDGLDAAAEAGVAAVVQPGGSVRDDEVIAAADEHGMTMVFTGARQFRH